MRNHRAVSLGLAIGVLFGASTGAHAQFEEKVAMSSLSVVGHGKVATVPDVADINLGVVTQAATAKDALSKNSEAMTLLQKALIERGVAAKDIETTQIQISPVYSQPNPRQTAGEEFVPRVAGYRVVNAVEVTARDISKLGELLDLVVQAGANQVHGIALRVANADQLLDEARRRAMADAKRKASLLAREAGVVLGPARLIIEAGASEPRQYNYGLQFQASMARSAPTPVSPGEQELSVTIQVTYTIMPPKS